MRKFSKSATMMGVISADFQAHVYPEVLVKLGAGFAPHVQAAVDRAATNVADSTPPMVEHRLSRVPPPGRAIVNLTFYVGSQSEYLDTSIKTIAQGLAYKSAIQALCERELGSKGKLLKLLASVGVR